LAETVAEIEGCSWTVTTILPAAEAAPEWADAPADPEAESTVPWRTTPLPEGELGLEPPQPAIARAAASVDATLVRINECIADLLKRMIVESGDASDGDRCHHTFPGEA
jgi:hypothetical protein